MADITITCKTCFKEYGVFDKKSAPKSFVCPQCKVGQTTTGDEAVSYAVGRIYPEGYYTGQMKF